MLSENLTDNGVLSVGDVSFASLFHFVKNKLLKLSMEQFQLSVQILTKPGSKSKDIDWAFLVISEILSQNPPDFIHAHVAKNIAYHYKLYSNSSEHVADFLPKISFSFISEACQENSLIIATIIELCKNLSKSIRKPSWEALIQILTFANSETIRNIFPAVVQVTCAEFTLYAGQSLGASGACFAASVSCLISALTTFKDLTDGQQDTVRSAVNRAKENLEVKDIPVWHDFMEIWLEIDPTSSTLIQYLNTCDIDSISNIEHLDFHAILDPAINSLISKRQLRNLYICLAGIPDTLSYLLLAKSQSIIEFLISF